MRWFSVIGFSILILIFFWLGCDQRESPENVIRYPRNTTDLTDEQLARAFCGACHQFPSPGLLEKSMWEGRVLKDMGRRLGVRIDDYDPYFQRTMMDAYLLRSRGIYPQDSVISGQEYQRIIDFYLNHAPPKIEAVKVDSLNIVLKNFKVHVINNLPAEPLATMVKFDTENSRVYWGSRRGDFMVIDTAGRVTRQVELPSGPSDLVISNGKEYLLIMGNMDPSEEALGSLMIFNDPYQTSELLTKLKRPVDFSAIDLNGDNLTDFLISQFGDQLGRLSWYEAVDTGYIERIIKKVPGAIQTHYGDFNKDGKPDIAALFTQGDEGISIFYQSDDGFREDRVLSFPPVYGSSSFQMVDFDGDNDQDILYTAGDNADFTFSLKNYHGVRVYLNDGENNFSEAYFYPMYGAMNAMASDFDQDGDMDIAAVSYFPDFDAPTPRGFVYLENQGDYTFVTSTFPQQVKGRWLVIDVADYDRDGDTDIVIGSLLFKIRAAPQKLSDGWTESNIHAVILENTLN